MQKIDKDKIKNEVETNKLITSGQGTSQKY